MIGELILFTACFALGCLSRFWYAGLSKVRKGVGAAATTALEFVSVGLLTAAFIIVLFFLGDGILMPFTALGVIAGFLFTSIFV